MLAVAFVAVEQPVAVDELPDRGNVAGAVHDGELRSRQAVDMLEQRLISEIGGLLDEACKVVRDEDRGVAVTVVRRVSGQADDAVVCNAASTGQVQRSHSLWLI